MNLIEPDGDVDSDGSGEVSTPLVPRYGGDSVAIAGLALTTVAGAPRTYVLIAQAAEPGENGGMPPRSAAPGDFVTAVVALDAEAALIPDFGTGGVTAVPGDGFDIEASSTGQPMFTALDAFMLPGRAAAAGTAAADPWDWRVHKLTTAGAPDALFATGGEARLPAADRPPLLYSEPDQLALDSTDRAYVVSAGCECVDQTERGALIVARLTSAGLLDQTFGTLGYRRYDLEPNGLVMGESRSRPSGFHADRRKAGGRRPQQRVRGLPGRSQPLRRPRRAADRSRGGGVAAERHRA